MKGSTVVEIKCYFCGKSRCEAMALIAEPDVYICESCVKLCVEILTEVTPVESKEDRSCE